MILKSSLFEHNTVCQKMLLYDLMVIKNLSIYFWNRRHLFSTYTEFQHQQNSGTTSPTITLKKESAVSGK